MLLIILHTVTGEINMEGIKNRLRNYDHIWMTFAAVEVLSDEEKKFLEPELELLITGYCGFPDINWSLYGEWGGWSGYPEEGRYPDTRREWNISWYMDCDPAAGTGRRYDHCSPDLYYACKMFFKKSIDSFRNGKHQDGVILLGILAHYLEDEATFGHMQALHRGEKFDFSLIDIKGYKPKVLGRNLDSALTAIEKRAREITAFVNEKNLLLRQAIKDGNRAEFQKIHLECNKEGAKATADMLRTAICLAGEKSPVKTVPFGTNLIKNPSFEDDDGSGMPEKWFINWRNLKDKTGRALWEKKLNRNTRNSHTGKGSASIMWAPEEGIEWKQRWPEAIYVSPGEKYYLTGWAKTHNATGNSYVTLECYKRNNTPVKSFKSVSLTGTNDWKKIGLEIIIPDEAEKAVAACRSENNHGITWFDDMELVRLKPEEPAKPQGIIGWDDLALYLPFEEKGYSIEDKSNYRDLNGPVITCSGKELADLHIKGIRGNGLEFDGKDDFLELPFSRVQDPLAAEKEIAISLWIYADKLQNACLLSKETLNGGYRIELSENGRISFLFSAGKKPVVESSTDYPLKEWFHFTCTAKTREKIRIYKNTELSAESEDVVTDINAKAADFYLAADRGVENFFKGRVDELKIYNRILDLSDITGLIK